MIELRTIAKISLLILLYYIVYSVYLGLLHPIPALGDSWDYHIPISQTILDGSFLHPAHYKLPQWYYPGSSEAINSLLMLLKIPLTVSNLFASIVLFFCLWKLALTFKLSYYYALLFAVTFISLTAVMRWFNAVSIDVWIAVFFTLALVLLENPKKTSQFFLKLGFVFGMLIGSKYTAILLVLTLLILYSKKLLPFISFSRIILFLIPFTIFGLFWYIRNYIFTGNPFFPLDILGFHGTLLFPDTILGITLQYPLQMFHAFFGEYKLWTLVLFLKPGILLYIYIHNKTTSFFSEKKLILIGIINFLFFLQFPTSKEEWIMVSSFRYSYPVFIPLFLTIFLVAKNYKKEAFVGYIALGNMIAALSFAYHPKLIVISLPLAFLCFYGLKKYEPKNKKLS